MARPSRWWGIAATFASVLALHQPVWAQDASSEAGNDSDSAVDQVGARGGQVIIVTARKRDENIQDVPISIASNTGEQLKAAGVENLAQLNTLVPSLNAQNIGGGTSYFLRGVGTVSSQAENQVLNYVDGVLVPNQLMAAPDLIDVEQVTVLRGPQGTLFGRNATGGVIQITTRDPQYSPEIEMETGIDNYGTWKSSVFAGGGLSDSVRASVTASYKTQADGWGYNPIADIDTYRVDNSVFLRGKLLFDLASNVSLEIAGDYHFSDGTTDLQQVPFPGTVVAFDPDAVVGTVGNRDARHDLPSTNELEVGGASADLRIDLDFAELRSITAYRSGRHDWQFDADRSPTQAFDIRDFDTFHNMSQELQLVSQGDNLIDWAVGGYFFKNVNETNPIIFDFYGPFAPNPDSTAQTFTFGSERATSYAAFAQGTIALTSQTNFTAGVRYTYEKRRLVGEQYNILNNGDEVPSASVDTSIEFNELTYRLGLDHQLNENLMVYFSYDKGFKSGGYSITSISNPPYSPEKIDAYEVGFKYQSPNADFQLNTSAFYYDYINIQVRAFDGLLPRITNAAAAEIYGGEAEADWFLSENFWISARAALLHAEFSDFPTAEFFTPIGGGRYTSAPGDATGNRLPYAQPFQGSLSANYRHETDIGDFTFNVTNSYNSDFYFDASNDFRQPSYNYLNLSLSWQSTDERFRAKIWATNLLDEQVATSAAVAGTGAIITYGNPPRLYGVTLGASF